MGCALLLAALACWAYYVFIAGNFHTVVADRCYRSGQLSVAALERTLRNYHIKTVINLRGVNRKADWYKRQLRLIDQLGRCRIDVRIGSSYTPSEAAIRRLVAALDAGEPPLLLHCGSGADRTGLAAAFYKLLKTDRDLDDACSEMSIRFGHNPLGGARCLDCVLDAYRRWLQKSELPHTPERFRGWATQIYSRAALVQEYHLPREPNVDDD
jgi:protein tyrosine phosphatase (PTP) superfamily phosphohydrolase (DUF442 family)